LPNEADELAAMAVMTIGAFLGSASKAVAAESSGTK